ncbi:MAG: fatty acid--CoA ligase [Hyphomonadaceae bacterium]|nr:fatty acid--CoA ligase [Hyphomonadaceae bacterium]
MAASLKPEEFDQMTTLGDIPRHHVRTRPTQVALSFEGRETTFAALDSQSNQAAAALLAAGIEPGDCISYFGKNSDHYFELLLGAAKIGAIIGPIGWRLSANEAAYIIDDAQAHLIFVGPECMALAEEAVAQTGARPAIIAMESGEHAHPAYEAWRNAQPKEDSGLTVSPEATSLLLYTSGTTGRPKGVMLSSANLLRSRRALAEARMGWNEWQEGEVSYCAMPVAHIGGTGWGLVGLINGVKTVVARDFNPMDALEAISRERIAKMFMVPAALQFVIRTPRAREIDYSSLTHILYGASPMPVDLLRECMEVFGCKFVQQYGMTETTGTITYLPPQDHDPKGNERMRSAGVPMPGVEMAIFDAEGNRLGPNTVGEIATRSAANMSGYWRKADATAATIDAEGWLRTGDAGYIDEDGYLFIQDRIKDMIITGGENVYPAEVENAVHGHPHVAEVAVIGVPDATWGESVKAIVVPKPGVTPDAADIIAFARSRIAHFKAPRSVDFLSTPLPRSASGKILRRELREPYWAEKERRVN